MSHQAIVSRINVELANDLGNLAQRSLSLIARNCDGVLPARGPRGTEDDAGWIGRRGRAAGLVRAHLERQGFHEALEEVWKVIRAANGYIDHQAPWALSRTDPARMGAVLRVLADTLRVVATVLQPFMPDSMAGCSTSSACRQRRGSLPTWPRRCRTASPCRRRRACSHATSRRNDVAH